MDIEPPPEPPAGSLVRDANGEIWQRVNAALPIGMWSDERATDDGWRARPNAGEPTR